MEKVSDFWKVLCLDFKYGFFTGVPFTEFKLLFNTMRPEFLHYVPTTNEISAVGLATGYFLTGYKSAVLLQAEKFDLIKIQLEKFNMLYKLPILIITESEYNPMKLKQFKLNEGLQSIEAADKVLYTDNEPVILVINEKDLGK